ncbi:hypothetical protein JRQ81_008551 [Phrynocephalus forsythii]|uniref:RING-type domain-containing protein n=1 Tax=Phrynocephalus forsythii TaxID=171643 RepID=A0A9Q0XAF2_9SAUR|nr:hypothetical protein JRQ81_008551 [Phrynocephalus forsythii]
MSSPETPFRSPQGSVSLAPFAAEAGPERRVPECAICYEAYQVAGGPWPKLLQCCHSVCLACLTKLLCPSPASAFVVCPFCRRVTVVPEGGLQALEDDETFLQPMAPAHGVARAARRLQRGPGSIKAT